MRLQLFPQSQNVVANRLILSIWGMAQNRIPQKSYCKGKNRPKPVVGVVPVEPNKTDWGSGHIQGTARGSYLTVKQSSKCYYLKASQHALHLYKNKCSYVFYMFITDFFIFVIFHIVPARWLRSSLLAPLAVAQAEKKVLKKKTVFLLWKHKHQKPQTTNKPSQTHSKQTKPSHLNKTVTKHLKQSTNPNISAACEGLEAVGADCTCFFARTEPCSAKEKGRERKQQ